jgi:hypothetical protein
VKIKFTLGPYGYEVVLGSITEKIYNQYCEDNDALRDAVSGFEENSGMKEWSENDDINHIYGAVLEEEGTDQYLAILDDQGNEILNTPLTQDSIKQSGILYEEDISHSADTDLSEQFYFFGQSGEKGEWDNEGQLFEVNQFIASDFKLHIANCDGLKIVYAVSYQGQDKVQLSVESSNPNYQNFEVRMGDDV